jgi:LCP family protein required for cell wall assembly
MATIPPVATVAPTFGPTKAPEPTLPPIPNVDEVFAFAERVTYGGATYAYNDDIVSLLFLGIDDPGKVTVRTEGFGKGNQTDVILLAAIDADKKKVTLLNISRDAMTNVNILSYDHKAIVGSRVMQVALSHAYGDGSDLSCLLAADAVAGLVGGLPMNGYVSLNYGALGILNDAVGGVTVTLDEDMTISGKEYKSGDAVAIKGDMAADYIRNRSAGEGTNSERMGRQEGYIKGFIGRCLTSGRNPAKLVMDLLGAADGYVVTSLTDDEIVYLGTTVLSGGWTVEIESVPGELKLNDIYEFYPDEAALSKILLDIFYTED